MTGHQCTGVTQDASDRHGPVRRYLFRSDRSPRSPGRAVIACDGIHSVVRKQFYPDDAIAFSGINTWRGVTRRKPILDGRSYLRIGSILTGKMVIYPIADDVDGPGNQLINWLCEIQQDVREKQRLEQARPARGLLSALCATGHSTGSMSRR